MDRRRFNPSPEGLEGRALLSLFGGKSASTNTTISIQDLPQTFKQKEQRIQNLPFFLEQTQPGRFLPPDLMTKLQVDMNAIVARLHAPTTEVVNVFNHGLQHALPKLTLSPQTARFLNNSFGSVLVHAGATPEAVANLQFDMNQLALVDSKSIEPSMLARNDYSLVLQTALSVGRPIQTPRAPSLAPNDGQKSKDGLSGFTTDHQPTMVGTYEAGATKIGFMRMQIIDSSGKVLGISVVDSAGNYSVKLSPLPDGIYQLRSQAIDEVGHVSNPSPHAFQLKVFTKNVPGTTVQTNTATPGGPLGLVTPS
jgi:hypothetical protein